MVWCFWEHRAGRVRCPLCHSPACASDAWLRRSVWSVFAHKKTAYPRHSRNRVKRVRRMVILRPDGQLDCRTVLANYINSPGTRNPCNRPRALSWCGVSRPRTPNGTPHHSESPEICSRRTRQQASSGGWQNRSLNCSGPMFSTTDWPIRHKDFVLSLAEVTTFFLLLHFSSTSSRRTVQQANWGG